jgi:hypothetical protein
MPPLRKRLLPILFLAVAGLQSGMAQEPLIRHDYTEIPDTFVEVESVFGTAARQGSLPFRITIRNNSGKDREWTVAFQEGNSGRMLSTKSEFRISVGKRIRGIAGSLSALCSRLSRL